MRIISQGEAVILGSYSFNPASGWIKENLLWWELIDSEKCRLVPLDGVQISHLGNPDFGEVTLESLRNANYSSEPVKGTRDGVGHISPGSVVAVTADRVYIKLRINGVYETALGVSWASYFP